MFKKILSTFIAFALAAHPIFLPAAETLSLEALLQEAQGRNPEILAAKKRWEAAQERIPQEKSLEAPSLSLTVEKIPKGTFQLNNTMPDDRMLSFSQFLPLFGKLSLRGKIALVESRMLAAEYKGKELEVMNAVKSAYFDLFMNYKETGLNEENLALLRVLSKTAEAQYAIGGISQEELFKIHLELARLNNAIFNLKQEALAQQTRLNALLNRDPESPLGVPVLKEETEFTQDIRSLYVMAQLNQPELTVFSYTIEKNKYARSLAQRSFFPDLMANIAQRGITSGAIGPWDLMLSFSMPFWFWTKQRYQVKEAIANLEEAEAAYEAMKNKAFTEVKDAAVKIEIAQNKIRLIQGELLPLLESSLKVSQAAFQSGQGELMALLDSQRMLVETKMDYYGAVVEYHTNLADLERLVGGSLTQETEVKK